MPLINNQLVTVDNSGPERSYIALAPQFTGTLQLLGVDAWGGPSSAIRVDDGKLELTSAVIFQSGEATLSVTNSAAVTFSNAVLHNPKVVLAWDKKNDGVKFAGVLVLRRPLLVLDSLDDLPETLEVLKAP